MGTVKMTKSEKFVLAHALAKKFTGSYKACFALALRHVNAVIGMTVTEMNKYIAVNVDGSGVAAEDVISDVQKKLSFFRAEVSENKIVLLKNTYDVKETLKEMGFKWAPVRMAWVKSCGSISEIIEIANKLAA